MLTKILLDFVTEICKRPVCAVLVWNILGARIVPLIVFFFFYCGLISWNSAPTHVDSLSCHFRESEILSVRSSCSGPETCSGKLYRSVPVPRKGGWRQPMFRFHLSAWIYQWLRRPAKWGRGIFSASNKRRGREKKNKKKTNALFE